MHFLRPTFLADQNNNRFANNLFMCHFQMIMFPLNYDYYYLTIKILVYIFVFISQQKKNKKNSSSEMFNAGMLVKTQFYGAATKLLTKPFLNHTKIEFNLFTEQKLQRKNNRFPIIITYSMI